MPFPDPLILRLNQWVSWSVANQARVLRYAFIPQAIVGLFLLLLGAHMGRDHFHLIRQGVRAPGTIVAYKQVSMSDGGGTHWETASMPIVKFQAADRAVQFRDWMGTDAEVLNVRVIVLYDPANPALAMIDRPVYNWIPWAPTFAVGLFLVLVAIKGGLRSLSAS